MVLSRYVKILQGASRTFRSNLLEVKVNPEISVNQTTAIFRACKIHTKGQPEISQNSEAPTIFHENVSSVKPKILGFTSQPASAYKPNFSKSDRFGNEICNQEDSDSESELYEPVEVQGALDTCDKDISHIAPFHQPAFNFAAYANDSPTIQELAKLGVELYKIEGMRNGMKILMRYTFEEMKPFIRFLHDSGVPANDIGAFITKNPYIFTQDMDDLHTRIRYLRAHNFDREMIARIVTKNPYWLMFKTRKIDDRLGHFQREFALSGFQVRALATKQPKLITYRMKSIAELTFAFREEMGFDKFQVKTILLDKPKLFMKSREKLVAVFDYIHNTMKLSHKVLCKQPKILTCRLHRLRNRHQYLEALGRNQFDPKQPMYVSPDALVTGTDAEFCRDVARTSVDTYNLYLKSL